MSAPCIIIFFSDRELGYKRINAALDQDSKWSLELFGRNKR